MSLSVDLNKKLSKVEIDVLQVMVCNKNKVWTLSDLHEALIQNDIKLFANNMTRSPSDLPNFLRKRPHLFTFDTQENFVTLKLDDSDLCQIMEQSNLHLVADIMKKYRNDVNNSMRIKIIDKYVIMFKSDWIYSKVSNYWKSCSDMKTSMNNDKSNDFQTISKCVHLKSIVDKNPNSDKVARYLVEILLNNSNETSENLISKVPLDIKEYLLQSGLQEFTSFYPSLFFVDKSSIKLRQSVSVIQLLPKLNLDVWEVNNFEVENDGSIVRCLLELMMSSHYDLENSKIVVVNDNFEQPHFRISWLRHNLPSEYQSQFINSKNFIAFVNKYANIFERTTSNLVKISNHALQPLLCEKTVSLEILSIWREDLTVSKEDIIAKLSPISRTRIRSVSELNNFLMMHENFHKNWNEVLEDVVDTTKIESPVSSDIKCHPEKLTELEFNTIMMHENFHKNWNEKLVDVVDTLKIESPVSSEVKCHPEKLTELEFNMIVVAGKSSNIWTLSNFQEAVIKHAKGNTTTFKRTQDLKKFLQKRPHLFTLQNDHVSSKFDNIDGLTYEYLTPASNKLDSNISSSRTSTSDPTSELQQSKNKNVKVIQSNNKSLIDDPKQINFQSPVILKLSNVRPTSTNMTLELMINHVHKVLENNSNDINNSIRIKQDKRAAIMFKLEWVYSKVKSDIVQWKSCSDMIQVLNKSKEFDIGSNYCHLKSFVNKALNPDKVARVIVEELFDHRETGTFSSLYDNLYSDIQVYLKSPEGLECFVKFYPELFVIYSKNVHLRHIPDIQFLPTFDFIVNSNIEDAEILNSLLNVLISMCHDAKNSKIFVLDNYDWPFFDIQCVWEKLPSNVKLQLFHNEALLKTLEKHPSIFELKETKYVQLKNRLSSQSFPSEKTVSLDIIRTKRMMSKATNLEIAANLSRLSQMRIRNSTELSKFIGKLVTKNVLNYDYFTTLRYF